MNNNCLYVLVETNRINLDNSKKILGIYDYDEGMNKITLLQTINLDKKYNLEGPFQVNKKKINLSNIPILPRPILPRPLMPIIRPPSYVEDPNDIFPNNIKDPFFKN